MYIYFDKIDRFRCHGYDEITLWLQTSSVIAHIISLQKITKIYINITSVFVINTQDCSIHSLKQSTMVIRCKTLLSICLLYSEQCTWWFFSKYKRDSRKFSRLSRDLKNKWFLPFCGQLLIFTSNRSSQNKLADSAPPFQNPESQKIFSYKINIYASAKYKCTPHEKYSL